MAVLAAGNAVGVDIGGTKISAAIVDPTGTVLTHERASTPTGGAAETARAIADLVDRLVGDDATIPVGVAAAGFIDRERERVLYSPNVGWRDEPLRERLGDLLGRPVVLDNDANAAAWGEYRFGAGHNAEVLAMVTLGTGIGGGLVIDGALMRGGFGIAGEFGHMRLVPDGRLCACGRHGCWEAYGSGAGLAATARALVEERPGDAALLLRLANGVPGGIDGHTVAAAADQGDVIGLESFAELAHWVGAGLANLTAVVDPDVVVLGGGVGESRHLSLAAVRSAYQATVSGQGFRPEPEIRSAILGNQAGMIGMADLARSDAR